jgi:HTH-type transcriptional regulator/antitoxin HigA
LEAEQEKLMTLAQKAVPEPQAILRAWMPFKEVLGVTSVHSEEDYGQARATIEVLLDEIGDNENHPLAEVLDYLADQVAAYEHVHNPIQEAEPKEVLRFLMDQHGLKQEDLADCAPGPTRSIFHRTSFTCEAKSCNGTRMPKPWLPPDLTVRLVTPMPPASSPKPQPRPP